jgi:hypothetical protein
VSRSLAEFESYGAEARKAALDHFGKSIEEIERILGKTSPNEKLRDNLAWTLWHYARGKAGQDGFLPELQSDLRRYVASLDKATRLLHDLLAKGHYANDAAASTVVIMLTAAGLDVERLLEQLDVILSVTKNVNADKSKGGKPPDNEFKILIDRVVDIFQLTTGRRATVTWDEIKHVFAGDFFKLAELVDAAVAAATQTQPRTNGALGKELQRLLRQ